ncbi:PHP domain-containing protein [Thiomicrorhabdus indica]|uniref:PHP domain-containing protein n=1 Tax=Thiomicrorhabdus indica TaxID=2267253 RepID=UPI002AA68896|nr:PHP domain-containing protein [Thiomicrorhabdus indica]
MKVDFHCHTNASDGSLSPEQIIDLALEHEVKCLAITDHDTTAGYEKVLGYAKANGIELISGVEISCLWQGLTVHIVALDFDVANSQLQNGLKQIRELRKARAEKMFQKLSSKPNAHLQALPEKVLELVGEGIIGRGHFAQAMIELGLVNKAQQAFDRFLKRGRIGYVKPEWPELEEVVRWITAAEGIAVIAHPKNYKLSSNKLNLLIEDFKGAGGQAIEVVNQSRSNADSIGMAQRAHRHGLHASLGSDFHRPEHRWRGLGWLAPLPKECRPVWELFHPSISEMISHSNSC